MNIDDKILALAFDPLLDNAGEGGTFMTRSDYARDLLMDWVGDEADNLIWDWHHDPHALPFLDAPTIELLGMTQAPPRY